MKKAIYLLALSLGATAMTADAQKNTILVYGDLGVGSSIDDNDNKAANFKLNAGVGYQFNQNWTIGLTGGYGTSRSKPDGATAWGLSDSYRFGPFVRYTKPVNKIFALWLQGEVVGAGGYSGSTATRTRTNQYSGVQALVYPGVSVFFCDRWALNFSIGGLGYESYSYKNVAKSNNGFGFNVGEMANIGLSVNIGTKAKTKSFKKHKNAEADQDGYEDWKRKRRVSDED